MVLVLGDRRGDPDDTGCASWVKVNLPNTRRVDDQAKNLATLRGLFRFRDEAVAPAKACTERAPQNASAWVVYARVLGSVGDNAGALAAATKGLEYAPRDQDLLRSQATALAALGRPEAKDALAAFDRFRSPDQSADLRISCAAGSIRCARDRELGHTIALRPVTKSLARR